MEKEEEEEYNEIQKLFEELPSNVNILEEQIDLKIQMEYYEQSKKFREDEIKYNLRKLSKELALPETSEERKKELLILLAGIDDVKAYRFLENFLKRAGEPLRSWTVLAFQESRMLIQTSLLEEQQFFISTGLGGKNKKLRYYMVMINRDRNILLTKTQQKLVKNEMIFALNKEEGEFESIEFSEGFCSTLFLLPVTSNVEQVSVQVITECNQYGNFLDEEMIITNVKILTRNEILDIIQQHENKKDTNI